MTWRRVVAFTHENHYRSVQKNVSDRLMHQIGKKGYSCFVRKTLLFLGSN